MNSTAATTESLRRPEGTIAYDAAGVGPLVVMVPGMGDLRSGYRFLAPKIADAGFTAVTTDLRGHGESSPTFSSYGDEDTAADIIALLEHLGRPAVLVGNSMAAAASIMVAARRPELVTGLVLLGPWARNPPNGTAAGRFFFRLMLARPWTSVVWNAYLPTLYAGTKPVDFAEYRRRLIASLRRPGYARAFSLTSHTSHAPAEAALPEVTAPALVIMGEKDPDFPDPAAEAAWLAGMLGAETVMLPEVGHYPQSQAPTETAAAVIPFLKQYAANA